MTSEPTISRGDQYSLGITLKADETTYITVSDVSKIEFCIGSLRKFYLSGNTGAVTYDSTTHEFSFPLTQAETTAMRCAIPAQARILWSSGDVQKVDLGTIDISESLSVEVLS